MHFLHVALPLVLSICWSAGALPDVVLFENLGHATDSFLDFLRTNEPHSLNMGGRLQMYPDRPASIRWPRERNGKVFLDNVVLPSDPVFKHDGFAMYPKWDNTFMTPDMAKLLEKINLGVTAQTGQENIFKTKLLENMAPYAAKSGTQPRGEELIRQTVREVLKGQDRGGYIGRLLNGYYLRNEGRYEELRPVHQKAFRDYLDGYKAVPAGFNHNSIPWRIGPNHYVQVSINSLSTLNLDSKKSWEGIYASTSTLRKLSAFNDVMNKYRPSGVQEGNDWFKHAFINMVQQTRQLPGQSLRELALHAVRNGYTQDSQALGRYGNKHAKAVEAAERFNWETAGNGGLLKSFNPSRWFSFSSRN